MVEVVDREFFKKRECNLIPLYLVGLFTFLEDNLRTPCRRLAVTSPIPCWHLADKTFCRQNLADHLLKPCQYLANTSTPRRHFDVTLPTSRRHLADTLPKSCRHPADPLPTTRRHLADTLPTSCRHLSGNLPALCRRFFVNTLPTPP